MLKGLLVAVSITLFASSAALAQDVNGQTGGQYWDSEKTDTVKFYQPQQPPPNPNYGPSPGQWQDVHSSARTTKQNLLPLATTTLSTLSNGGGKLQKTVLDSLVARTGFNDMVFGDEGTYGPPPLDDFATIGEAGGVTATTGHQSNAPSAWGVPMGPGLGAGPIYGKNDDSTPHAPAP
jgi:hypothetical protein